MAFYSPFSPSPPLLLFFPLYSEAFSKWKKSGEFSIVIEGEGGGRKKSVTEWEVRLILPLLTTGLCSQIDLRGFYYFFFFFFIFFYFFILYFYFYFILFYFYFLYFYSMIFLLTFYFLSGIPFTRLPFEFELLDPSKMRFIYMDADKLKVIIHTQMHKNLTNHHHHFPPPLPFVFF